MKGTILVVDDEPITRQSLSDILRLEGYEVASVANGEEAIEHMKQNYADLLILDLRMPGMGGVDVMHAMSQISQDAEIILLTAHGSMESAVDALRYRIHDYLLKPASPKQILDSVERGLARRAMRFEQGARIDFTRPVGTTAAIRFSDGTWVDIQRRMVGLEEFSVQLTQSEGQLLKVFLENPGKVYSHRDLVLLVQGYSASQGDAQEILRPLVSRLRQKVKPFAAIYDHIISVRGTGYVFDRIV
jgi:DNA-binding response OmpR family regulator